MEIDFETAITFYEFIAILLAVAALVIPFIKWACIKMFTKLKIDFIPSGKITLYHNRSGSYISLGGVYEAKNKSTTIKEISAKVIRNSDNATLPLIWSTFPSPIFKKIAGNYETSFETAHPFKVESDALVPAFVEFENSTLNMYEITGNKLSPIVNKSVSILVQPDITVIMADSKVKALPEYNEVKLTLNEDFFWKSGEYEIILTTSHSKGTFEKKYNFQLSDDESSSLRRNIDNLLLIHVADHFRLSLPMNSIKKEFKE